MKIKSVSRGGGGKYVVEEIFVWGGNTAAVFINLSGSVWRHLLVCEEDIAVFWFFFFFSQIQIAFSCISPLLLYG